MTINVQEITSQIFCSRTISPLQRELMSTLLAQGDLNEQDRALIARVFYGLRRGFLKQ